MLSEHDDKIHAGFNWRVSIIYAVRVFLCLDLLFW